MQLSSTGPVLLMNALVSYQCGLRLCSRYLPPGEWHDNYQSPFALSFGVPIDSDPHSLIKGWNDKKVTRDKVIRRYENIAPRLFLFRLTCWLIRVFWINDWFQYMASRKRYRYWFHSSKRNTWNIIFVPKKMLTKRERNEHEIKKKEYNCSHNWNFHIFLFTCLLPLTSFSPLALVRGGWLLYISHIL